MVGVAQQDLGSQLFERGLRNCLNRGLRAHGHEHGSLYFAVRRPQASRAGRALLRFYVECQ
jgi:hypothetical protein